MSVGIGSDPEKATVSNNDGCVLLFEQQGCGGNSVPIKIPYQGMNLIPLFVWSIC